MTALAKRLNGFHIMKVCPVAAVFQLVGSVLNRWRDSRLSGECNNAATPTLRSPRPKFLGGAPRPEKADPLFKQDKVEPWQVRVTRVRGGKLLPPGVSNLATERRLRRDDPRNIKRRPF